MKKKRRREVEEEEGGKKMLIFAHSCVSCYQPSAVQLSVAR